MPQLVSDCATSDSSGVYNYGAFKFRLTMFGLRNLVVLSVLFGIVAATAANEFVSQGLILPLKSVLMITVGVLNVCYDTVHGSILTAHMTEKRRPSWCRNSLVLSMATIANLLIRMNALYTLVAAPCAVWKNFSFTNSSNFIVFAIYFQDYSGFVALFQFIPLALVFAVICVTREPESFSAQSPLISETSIVFFFFWINFVWLSTILVCIVRTVTSILVCIVRTVTSILVCIVRTVTYILTMPFRVGAILTPPLFDSCSLFTTGVMCGLSWPVLLILWYQTRSLQAVDKCIQGLSECGDKYRVILCSILCLAWVPTGLIGMNLRYFLILTITAVLSTKIMRDVVTKLVLCAEREIPNVGAQIVNEINGWSARLDGSST